jgi:glutaminase
VSGSVYEAGESAVPFTIQSISKPFVYALALADAGVDDVLARVGVEPSGEAFNAISLEPTTGRPDNPLINAGAILTSSLVSGSGPEERFDRIRDQLSRCAGRDLDVDEEVFRSERDTGDRNRALAHLMRSTGSLTVGVEEAVEVYFRQCSVLVTAVDLAVMGATLANGGVNPRTGVAAVDQDIAERVLTVMATCGMYDFSGEWLFRVGLPAKSGVSGGLVAVSPSQFGIGMHSPRLDARGNSVRGVEASRAISERFSLHVMHQVTRSGPSFVRVAADGSERPVGPPPEGGPDDDVRLLSMQGYIEFTTAEQALLVVRLHVGDADAPSAVVVELDHVTGCHPVATVLLDATIAEVTRHGITVVTVDRSARRLLHAAAEFTTRAEALAHLTAAPTS